MSWLSTIGRLLLLGPFYKMVGSAKAKRQPTDAREQSASVAGGSARGSFLGSMARSLFLSAIVIGASFALMLVNPTLGVIAMMLYSSYMVINSSRKEMPLNRFTALLPGVMSIVAFLVMLGLIRSFDIEIAMLGMVPGAVIGYLMARGHKVYEKNGIVYAKRTFFYIVIWAVSMLITQGSTLFGVREITEFSSMLNGFSTAMMVVLSVFLFIKALGGGGMSGRTRKRMTSAVFLAVSVFTVSILFNTTQAISGSKVDPTYSLSGKYIGPAYLSQRTPVPPGIYSGGPDPYRWKNLTHRPSHKSGSWWQSSTGSGEIARVRVNNNGSMELLDEVKCRVKESYGDSRKGTRTDVTYDVRFKQTSPVECAWCDGKLVVNRQINRQGNKPADGNRMGRQRYQHTDQWDIRQRPDGVLMLSFSSCCSEKIRCSEQWLLYREGGSTSSPSPNSTTSSSSYPSPSPSYQPGRSPQPNYDPRSDFEFTDDEQAAGVLLALMLLATGVGMNAAISAVMSGAMTAAQEAANAGAMAGQADDNYGYDSRTHSNGTLMLDGDEARDWMKDNGYLDENGRPNEKYTEFMNAMDSDPVEKGLRGFAGDLDDDGNPTGDYVIIVDDEGDPASQPDDSREPDDQTEDTNEGDQDQSTDSSSSDSDDGDATKMPGSETRSPENQKTGTTDDSDQNDTPDTSTKDSKDTESGSTTSKKKPPVEQTLPIEYPNAKEDLEKLMDEISKEKTKEGYYVKNRHDFERTFDYLHERHPEDYNEITKELTLGLGLAYDKITKVLNNFPLLSGGVDYLWEWNGGQCGEYSKWGMDWSKKHLTDKYGDGTLIDEIVYMSKKSDDINHGATKIILPNGDKYILDYWESMQTKRPAVYTEEEWIKKCENSRDLGKGGDVSMTTGERTLKNAIGVPKLGEEKGKQWFLDHAKDKKIANSIIKAWEKKPW